MTYSFDSRIAEMYGVDEAVFIHNLYWWIRKNEANGRHYYDGRNWTYNSMDAFTKLFPFWSRRQVERIIRKLRDNGAIYTGNYNQRGFDRTQWYALSESVSSIYVNGEMDNTKWGYPLAQTVTPIPDSKPDINTDSKPDNIPSLPHKGNGSRFDDFWKAYPKKKAKADAEKAWRSKAVEGDKHIHAILSAIERQKQSADWQKDNGKFIPFPATWLRGRRWEDSDGVDGRERMTDLDGLF